MSGLSIDDDLVVSCAQELIRAPSENPPGDERATAEVAARYCTDAGLDVELLETAPKRVNVLATLDSGKPGKTLMWNGHIDVVPIIDPSLWAHPPFQAVIEDGVMHGRGSADMKGACAAAIAAASAMKAAGLPKKGRLVLHLVADEETLGPHGTRALLDRGMLQADACVVGEPTRLSIGLAERGMLWIIARTFGVAAHGSRPDLGVNAIVAMSKLVLAVTGMASGREHPLLGPPTLNVGTVRGGAKINIVPASCEAEIDRRTLPGETPDQILGEMRAVIDAIGDPDLKYELDQIMYAPPCEIDETEDVVGSAQRAHEHVLGEKASLSGMSFATDAHSIIGGAKIPAIIFGPGDIAQAHTTNEFVEIQQLLDAARIYAALASDFLS